MNAIRQDSRGAFTKGFMFFIGWILSPLTWWNDTFVNIPISYVVANMLFYLTRLPFGKLMVGIYWLTNILGLYLMWHSGSGLIISSKNKWRSTTFLLLMVIAYSGVMIYIDKRGSLLPINGYIAKYRLIK